MLEQRLSAWLRPVMTLMALAGALSLAGCGGGGGSPSNAYQGPPPTTPALTVLPATATVYSLVPDTLTITSGTAPFQLFSTNSAVLPVPPTTTSTTIGLLPNSVGADESVTVTIRDASGQTATSAITVKPSLLLPSSITITGNPVCGGSGAQLCSGQDGTATVKVTGTAGAPLSGRAVRFDVVLGDFALIGNNSTVPAQSLTVLTDQNGLAAVTIRVPATALTQFGTLRATDISTGSSVIAQFTIAQYVNGNSVLSVIPTGKTTFTGRDTAHCADSGIAAFYIFGGTPPYMVATNFPTAVSLIGVPVLASGGSFAVSPNGTCFTGLTFAITDAAGRTLLTPPTVDNVVGTAEPIVPLAIVPSEFPIGGGTTSCGGNSFQFLISGGTTKYSASVSAGSGASGPPGLTPTTGAPTGGQVTVSFPGTVGSFHGDWNVNVTDGTQIVSGKIHCS